MKTCLGMVLGVLLTALAAGAQPPPDREELRTVPLDNALVLDPALGWVRGRILNETVTQMAATEAVEGGLRVVVAEPGKCATWSRRLLSPLDPERYPFAVVTYRAWGLSPTNHGLLVVIRDRVLPILGSREAIADGEVHDVVVDLAELGVPEGTDRLWLSPCCQGPDPAVFELLGLRFESDGHLPPADNGPESDFSIQVIDRKKRPLAGATVTLDAELLNGARSAVTGADGTAFLRPSAALAGRHTVRITMDGMAPVEIIPQDGEDLPAKVMLLRGTRYGGIVRNEEGEPVPYVAVRLTGSSDDGTPRGRSWRAEVLTDEAGRWLTPVLPDEKRLMPPILEHADYQSGVDVSVSTKALRKGTGEMVIRHGFALRGSVLSPDGQPVAGADIRCSAATLAGTPDAKSDARGCFAFGNLQRNRAVQLVAQHPRFGPATVVVDLGGQTEEAVLRLQPPVRLFGQVVDLAGEPVAKARLRVQGLQPWGMLRWEATADHDGRFAWDNAPPDQVLLHVEGGRRMRLGLYPVQATPEGVTIVLPPILRVSGTVTDAATGQALAGCRVSEGIVPAGWTTDVPLLPQWVERPPGTGRSGQFEVALTDAEIGHQLVVRIERDGYTPVQSRPFRLDEGEQTLDVALAAAGTIAGVVQFPDGRPAGETTVYLATPDAEVTIGQGHRVSYSRAPSVQTGPDGRFRFSGTSGPWCLVAFREEGYAEVDGEAFAASGKLVLQPWGCLEGVYWQDGRPVPECRVEARRYFPQGDERNAPVSYILSAVTGDDGAFSIPGVPPGLARVLSAPARTPHVYGIPSSRRQVEIVSGQTVRRDIGTTGQAVVGQLGLAAGVAGTVAWEATGATISPRFRELGDGPSSPVHLATMSVEERMAWCASPAGKALVAAWRLHDRAIAEAAAETGQPVCRFAVEASGRFRIPDLPPGDYRLIVACALASPAPAEAGTRTPVGIVRDFTVPAIPGGWSAEPLDLGTLLLEARK